MLQSNPNPGPVEGEVGAARVAAAPERALALDPNWRAGRKLTEARLQLGLGIDQIAERIRVRREFLEALEQMNVKLLPGKAYALAFLRSYARELGLDEKAIVDQFQDECALSREDAQVQIRNPSSKPRRERPWLLAVALGVIAAGFVGWRALTADAPAAQAPTQVTLNSPPPLAQHGAAPERTNRVVEIRAVQEGWLEARGPDGTVFLSRTLQPGDVYRPDASPGWTLHARDGGAFELYVNGEAAGLLGTSGMPVLGRAIDDVQPMTQAGVVTPRS